MVEPIASRGQDRKMDTLLAAVVAVTYMVPSTFTELWSMTLPMAVMENCRPMGTPSDSRFQMRRQLQPQSPLCIFSTSKPRQTFHKLPKPATNWLMVVAKAAPNTPQCRLMMKNRSRPMLMTEATTSQMTAVRLSPSERKMPEHILYRI